MTALRVKINVALVAIAASYMTLGAANEDVARDLWWAYGLLTAILAIANLILAHRGHPCHE